jgi:hypothetical protein
MNNRKQSDTPIKDNDPIPQEPGARKAWLDKAWAERGRHGLE